MSEQVSRWVGGWREEGSELVSEQVYKWVSE